MECVTIFCVLSVIGWYRDQRRTSRSANEAGRGWRGLLRWGIWRIRGRYHLSYLFLVIISDETPLATNTWASNSFIFVSKTHNLSMKTNNFVRLVHSLCVCFHSFPRTSLPPPFQVMATWWNRDSRNSKIKVPIQWTTVGSDTSRRHQVQLMNCQLFHLPSQSKKN